MEGIQPSYLPCIGSQAYVMPKRLREISKHLSEIQTERVTIPKVELESLVVELQSRRENYEHGDLYLLTSENGKYDLFFNQDTLRYQVVENGEVICSLSIFCVADQVERYGADIFAKQMADMSHLSEAIFTLILSGHRNHEMSFA